MQLLRVQIVLMRWLTWSRAIRTSNTEKRGHWGSRRSQQLSPFYFLLAAILFLNQRWSHPCLAFRSESKATGLVEDDVAKGVSVLTELWELALRLAVVPVAIAVDDGRAGSLHMHIVEGFPAPEQETQSASSFERVLLRSRRRRQRQLLLLCVPTLSELVLPLNTWRISARSSRRNAGFAKISR